MMTITPVMMGWIGLGLAAWLLIWRVWVFRLFLKLGLKVVLLLGPVVLAGAAGLALLN